ncbi:hypothetical protein ACKI1J_45830, partial [Streptomyces scabiei]
DPDAYLERLHRASGGRWTVVEKILADGERLPAAWPVAGTTGYDALRHVDGLFTDPDGYGQLLDRYRRFAAPRADLGGDWAATVRRAAYRVLTHELATELDRLTRVAHRLCAAAPDPALRDRAPWALRTALLELLVRLEVYRPYTSVDAATVVTEEAAAEARLTFAVPEEAGAVDVVRDLVLGRYGDGPEQVQHGEGEGQGEDPGGAGLPGVAQQEAGQGTAEQQEERHVHDGPEPPGVRVVVRLRHPSPASFCPSLLPRCSPTCRTGPLSCVNTPMVPASDAPWVNRSDDPAVARSVAQEQPERRPCAPGAGRRVESTNPPDLTPRSRPA